MILLLVDNVVGKVEFKEELIQVEGITIYLLKLVQDVKEKVKSSVENVMYVNHKK